MTKRYIVPKLMAWDEASEKCECMPHEQIMVLASEYDQLVEEIALLRQKNQSLEQQLAELM